MAEHFICLKKDIINMGKESCQSCGMPLVKGLYGLNSDGTVNIEYCKLCFENGVFREPNLTLEEMEGRSMARMVDEMDVDRVRAEDIVSKLIPTLKRWKN